MKDYLPKTDPVGFKIPQTENWGKDTTGFVDISYVCAAKLLYIKDAKVILLQMKILEVCQMV